MGFLLIGDGGRVIRLACISSRSSFCFVPFYVFKIALFALAAIFKFFITSASTSSSSGSISPSMNLYDGLIFLFTGNFEGSKS